MPKKRNCFSGDHVKSPVQPIELPYTLASFRELLADGMRADSRYTHEQIKDWASLFWWTQTQHPLRSWTDVPPEIKKAADIAQDIEMQWDMYLVNSYTLPELQSMDSSQVRLPTEWFANWLARLSQLMRPAAPEEPRNE
jgi:hypothetical protein